MTFDHRLLRLYVDAPFSAGVRVPLAEPQAHYVTNVMRLKAGGALRVFNGRDGEWSAKLVATGKKSAAVELDAQTRAQTRDPDLWLAFAPVKRAKLDLVVEKACELGVATLWPVITQRTNAERVNTERMRAIAVEAAEQCERLTVADVRAPIALTQMISTWPRERRLYMLDESGGGVALSTVLDEHASQPCGFLVGPEGGFTQTELDALRQLPFVTRVGLGPRILRAETAAIAALVIWQSRHGDWT